jgi:hypothetical protein
MAGLILGSCVTSVSTVLYVPYADTHDKDAFLARLVISRWTTSYVMSCAPHGALAFQRKQVISRLQTLWLLSRLTLSFARPP